MLPGTEMFMKHLEQIGKDLLFHFAERAKTIFKFLTLLRHCTRMSGGTERESVRMHDDGSSKKSFE